MKTADTYFLKTERLLLREVLSNDLERIHQLNLIPEVDKYNTLGIPENIDVTRILITDWINSQHEYPRKRYVYIIENTAQQFAGLIAFNIGKPKYHTAEIWYKLHPTHWNKGYATEAVKCILKYCFSDLKLHRITAGCATENKASIKVLERCGFINEGLCRKILPIRGEWKDNYMYAILEEDYYPTK